MVPWKDAKFLIFRKGKNAFDYITAPVDTHTHKAARDISRKERLPVLLLVKIMPNI